MPSAQESASKVLKGSLMLKIIFLMAFGLLFSVFIFGMPQTIGDWAWTIIRTVFGIMVIILILKGIAAGMKPAPRSPTSTWKNKLIRAAELAKPFNVKDLYIRGEDMRVNSWYGKIKGMLYIPYWASTPELDAEGKPQFEEKIDLHGNKVIDKDTGKPVMVQKMKKIKSDEGEWLFVVSRASNFIQALFNREKVLVRAHVDYVSDIGDRVWIKTVNPLPLGDFHYPHQQWQSDIEKTTTQYKSEIIMETWLGFLDLSAQGVDMALGSDPTFQKYLLSQSESLSSQSRGVLVRGE